jgi:hypothetical protein
MSMKLTYKLVGYDRGTEMLVEQHVIPQKYVMYAKGVARIRLDDADAIGDMPLDAGQAKDIAGAIGVKIDPAHRDYFFERYSEQAATSHSEHA